LPLRPPHQNGNASVAQLLQVADDYVHLRAPAFVEAGAGSEQLAPLEIRKATLHAVAEGDRLIVGGADGVPGEGNDGAITILAHGLGDERRAGERGVLIGAALKAEILAEDGGVFAGEIVGAVGPIGDGVWVVMLAGEDVVSGD